MTPSVVIDIISGNITFSKIGIAYFQCMITEGVSDSSLQICVLSALMESYNPIWKIAWYK